MNYHLQITLHLLIDYQINRKCRLKASMDLRWSLEELQFQHMSIRSFVHFRASNILKSQIKFPVSYQKYRFGLTYKEDLGAKLCQIQISRNNSYIKPNIKRFVDLVSNSLKSNLNHGKRIDKKLEKWLQFNLLFHLILFKIKMKLWTYTI